MKKYLLLSAFVAAGNMVAAAADSDAKEDLTATSTTRILKVENELGKKIINLRTTALEKNIEELTTFIENAERKIAENPDYKLTGQWEELTSKNISIRLPFEQLLSFLLTPETSESRIITVDQILDHSKANSEESEKQKAMILSLSSLVVQSRITKLTLIKSYLKQSQKDLALARSLNIVIN